MFREKYEMWLESPYVDEKIKEELKTIEKIDSEIEDRFYKDLEFGTGGMRGKIGAGTNRINIQTVSKATQGISNFINEKYPNEAKKVAIAYDSRHMSAEFARASACVFAANGIEVYLFESLRPTPELSYAVRYFKCKAGVVITASHNPPDYNGYKVYDENGGQVTKDAEYIIDKINSVKLEDIKSSQYQHNKSIKLIGCEIDSSYIEEIKKLSLRSNINKSLKIVYTPLHGTGNKLVRKILEEMEYSNVTIVKEQENPDPDFSTVKSPNPEEISSFEMAIGLAKEVNGEIIIGTDPDCDRVGLVVKSNDEYIALNGNQTGALLLNYVLSTLKEQKRIPDNGAIIKTIVTSEIGRLIASNYGVTTIDTLTGFKYIAELIQSFEESNEHEFIFGYEESYGYLSGTFVRDKDAVIASMLICEMAAYYKTKNKNLLEILDSIYEEYGCFKEETLSLYFNGISGQNKMKMIMEHFRENKINLLAGKKIPLVYDYKMSIASNLVNGQIEKIYYPKSDVLKFCFEDDSWVVLRPSGTEPKLKVYFSIKGENEENALVTLQMAKEEIQNIIERIQYSN
ncbi:phosphoglucomutase [Sedimentibacter acidaminivorans]|uniref:Phosphoglucomutase n=1 Tax=Sedimentibacter acidaminivorans TaxID=913099 RepID=A0ABS4GGI7_9FIRM|nr:phospho-sugar mutase [Sedimentibacter acidaminivorans]MBP1926812.1 phosphoglucomutase [Sedimentibacter acidaminivorans]